MFELISQNLIGILVVVIIVLVAAYGCMTFRNRRKRSAVLMELASSGGNQVGQISS